MAERLPPVYNTAKPVGAGEPNFTDDVKLIQQLLIDYARLTPAWTTPSQALLASGAYTPVTGEWILSFQKFARTRGITIATDGKVHPMRTDNRLDWHAHFGGSWSTLYCLNVAVRKKDRAAHDGYEMKLPVPEVDIGSA